MKKNEKKTDSHSFGNDPFSPTVIRVEDSNTMNMELVIKVQFYTMMDLFSELEKAVRKVRKAPEDALYVQIEEKYASLKEVIQKINKKKRNQYPESLFEKTMSWANSIVERLENLILGREFKTDKAAQLFKEIDEVVPEITKLIKETGSEPGVDKLDLLFASIKQQPSLSNPKHLLPKNALISAIASVPRTESSQSLSPSIQKLPSESSRVRVGSDQSLPRPYEKAYSRRNSEMNSPVPSKPGPQSRSLFPDEFFQGRGNTLPYDSSLSPQERIQQIAEEMTQRMTFQGTAPSQEPRFTENQEQESKSPTPQKASKQNSQTNQTPLASPSLQRKSQVLNDPFEANELPNSSQDELGRVPKQPEEGASLEPQTTKKKSFMSGIMREGKKIIKITKSKINSNSRTVNDKHTTKVEQSRNQNKDRQRS